jgi:hypothetical protein
MLICQLLQTQVLEAWIIQKKKSGLEIIKHVRVFKEGKNPVMVLRMVKRCTEAFIKALHCMNIGLGELRKRLTKISQEHVIHEKVVFF